MLDRERLSKVKEKEKGATDVGSATYSISFSACPDKSRRWGVRMVVKDDALVIRHIDPGGLIDCVGLVRVGDSIISVNGVFGPDVNAIDSQILTADKWHVTLARKS